MDREDLIDKLLELAGDAEDTNIEVSAMLYSIVASIYTGHEKILFDKVQKTSKRIIFPDLMLMAEAGADVSKLLDELNMN